MDEAPERSDELLRRVFHDIMRGFSPVAFEKEKVFLKHFTYREQGAIEEAYTEAFEKARSQGLDTEKDCFALLEEEGIWTAEEEAKIAAHKDYLLSLEQTRSRLAIPSQIDALNKDISAATTTLEKMEIKKQQLLPETCESYGKKKSNDLMIYHAFYKNKKCTKKLFTWDEYCRLPKEKLYDCFEIYNKGVSHLSMDNIKHLALSNFFALYGTVLGSKNMHLFLHKPMQKHTFYQLHLLNYGKILSSILENVKNIPEEYKSDPDRLMDYASSSGKAEELRDRSKEKDGYSIVGASKDDMAKIGISSSTPVSLEELAKAKGGSLSMEDFAKLS